MSKHNMVKGLLLLSIFFGGCGDAVDPKGMDDANSPGDLGLSDIEIDLSPGSAGTTSLVDLSLFEPVEAGGDPFVSHRPEEIQCEVGFAVEDAVFEVETDKCNYGTFVQPMLVELEAGDQVRLVVWHLSLWAAEPAEAHVAIQLGETLIWEAFSPIPGSEEVWDLTVDIETPVSAGTPAFFHLHNHGYNSWRLGLIDRIRD